MEEGECEELSAAELRRVEVLTSDELGYLDQALLEAMDTSRWRKLARVVFVAVKAVGERVPDVPYKFAGDRVRRLVALGAVLSRGDLFRMRFCEVRLPDPEDDEDVAV